MSKHLNQSWIAISRRTTWVCSWRAIASWQIASQNLKDRYSSFMAIQQSRVRIIFYYHPYKNDVVHAVQLRLQRRCVTLDDVVCYQPDATDLWQSAVSNPSSAVRSTACVRSWSPAVRPVHCQCQPSRCQTRFVAAPIGEDSIGAMGTFAQCWRTFQGTGAKLTYCNLKIIQCLPLFARSWISPIASFKSRQRHSGSSKTIKFVVGGHHWESLRLSKKRSFPRPLPSEFAPVLKNKSRRLWPHQYADDC